MSAKDPASGPDDPVPGLLIIISIPLITLGVLWPEDGWTAMGLYGSGMAAVMTAIYLLGVFDDDE